MSPRLGTAVAMTLFFAAGGAARAGPLEVGASGSYRRTNLDNNAYNESASITGSIGYYLSEMTAFELSYTDGQSNQFIGAGANGFSTVALNQTTKASYKMVGLDFVYTFGDRDSFLRPYAKLGSNYLMEKKLVQQFQGYSPVVTEDSPAVVPSAGIGF